MTGSPVDLETLRSLAELAIAFAGFAALAGVIGDRRRIASRHNLVRLQAVVFSSLIIVISAYVPIVAFAFGLGDRLTWQIASAVSLPLNWIALLAMMRLGHLTGLHGADRWFTRLGYPLEVLVEVPLFINLFALLPRHAFAFFLVSLTSVLLQTIIAFVILIASLLRPQTPPRREARDSPPRSTPLGAKVGTSDADYLERGRSDRLKGTASSR